MQLRWRTVVVTAAGSGLGREVALRFARAGAGIVVVDPDAAIADEVAGLVRERRVGTWVVQADVGDGDDLALLTARLLDLGGADVVVHASAGPPDQHLVDALVAALCDRRDGPGAVVLVGAPGPLAAHPGRARVMGVEVAADAEPGPVAGAVLDLVARGAAGDVVRLGG